MLKPRKSQQQEAAIQYQKTLMLRARSLSARTTVPDAAQASHFVTRQALALVRQRYGDGSAHFLMVLDGFAGEQQYVTSTTNVSLNLVQLFKALAGGWSLIEFARYQDLRLAVRVLLGAISRKTTIELHPFGDPRNAWTPYRRADQYFLELYSMKSILVFERPFENASLSPIFRSSGIRDSA